MTWDQQDSNEPKKGPWGGNETPRGRQQKNDDGGTPWGRKPGGGSGGGGEGPDIDAMFKDAQERLNSMLSPKGGGRGGMWIIFGLFALLWLSTGFYRVLPEENAVLLTFGKWTATRGESGLGYHIPWPVQMVRKVNVAFDRRVEIGFREEAPGRIRGDVSMERSGVPSESQMLTGDENIVDIDFVVMWRIADARKYLFNIRDPETTIKKVAESGMREIVGRDKIQRALTEGRADIEAKTKDLMQKILDEYQSGISINSVQLLRVDPPAPVVDAFDDVQRARADKERAKNEADTYRNGIVPVARGDAQKLIKDAEAYREAVLSKAKGEADRFQSVYNAYAQAKDVTARRMYIETIEDVLQNSNKVIVGDGKSASAVLPYLPLDRLPGRAKAVAPAPAAQESGQ